VSVAINYYLGLRRDQQHAGQVVAGTAPGGTNADVEVRMQIDNGTTTTGLTKMDAVRLLEIIEQYIEGNGVAGGLPGTDLPSN
jgi:hypothetical protein